MTKKDKLETLMLISALESYCWTNTSKIPDHLIEEIGYVVEKLKADILESDAVHYGIDTKCAN